MDATTQRVIEALAADMSAMAVAALALETYGVRHKHELDDLYTRIRDDADLIRELRK